MSKHQGPEPSGNPAEITNGDISKSQRKRAAHAVLELARELVDLNDSRLERVPLDDAIRDAVRETRAIRSHVARKRQLQYLAKLLRRDDTGPITEALDDMRNEARQGVARHHRAESWRDRLLRDGDAALSELLEKRPGMESQAIRQCIRAATREAAAGKPPAAARRLFRLLLDLDTSEALPPSDPD